MSLRVVGADFPNKRGPTRRFEIAICTPGEPVYLEHEPRNPADHDAIMVMSERAVLLGYVAADRTSLIHKAWREGREVFAVFQAASSFGAWIRIGFDLVPELPATQSLATAQRESSDDPDTGFWPDYIPPDE